MVNINDFALEKQCEYKDRIYSVRDNGSVYRHQKEGKRPTQNDNKWTFGNKNMKTGYMMIASERVHQIVARAFHGEPEIPTMVVDHIDTNRCNNRPENLRWCTKLENALNNPYTRDKIIYHCGSVEAFINDPSILRGKALEQNISWMRTVSKEEAERCLEHLDRWLREDYGDNRSSSASMGMGEWIYKENVSKGFEQQVEPKNKLPYSERKKTEEENNKDNFFNAFEALYDSDRFIDEIHGPYAQKKAEIEAERNRSYEKEQILTNSLTPGAKQLYWNVPSEFPLCPSVSSENPLQEYLKNLEQDKTFCQNSKYHSEVIKAELSLDKNHISVLTTTSGVKNFALAEIRYENEVFIHESVGTFFDEDGAEKYYTLSLGKEWTGGDVFDDYC